jgi:hypothetical protein
MVILPLATVDDFKAWGSNAELVQNEQRWTQEQLTRLMIRATTHLQSRCLRRLTPFTGKVESYTAYGISPEEYGEQGDLPMDLTGALGWSAASSMGVSSMVREFWLEEVAPLWPEWWTYTLDTVEILRTFGDTQVFNAANGDMVQWQGPEVDTGHIKMPIGTYCPVGSTIRTTYGGGYDPIPDDLNLATIMVAQKLVILGDEPGGSKHNQMGDVDEMIVSLLGSYARYIA